MKVLHISGDVQRIEEDFSIDNIIKRTMDNGGSLVIDESWVYAECEVMEFPDVPYDEKFIWFIKYSIMSEESIKKNNFYVINEDKN